MVMVLSLCDHTHSHPLPQPLPRKVRQLEMLHLMLPLVNPHVLQCTHIPASYAILLVYLLCKSCKKKEKAPNANIRQWAGLVEKGVGLENCSRAAAGQAKLSQMSVYVNGFEISFSFVCSSSWKIVGMAALYVHLGSMCGHRIDYKMLKTKIKKWIKIESKRVKH